MSACVVHTVKHGEGGVVVWGCFAGDTVIHSKCRAHLTSMAPTAVCSVPSHLVCAGLVGSSFAFQQDSDPKHTSTPCKGYLTKKKME